MQSLTEDHASIEIAAPPDVVYALISDVTRMPDFSPELVACRWLDGATGPGVGARFEAVNRVVGSNREWKNRPVVIEHQPGRLFAISRTEPFAGTVEWRYELQPVGSATRLTESYAVTKPVSRIGWLIIEKGFNGKDRRSALRAGMLQTLAAVKQAAERLTDPASAA